MKHNCFCLEMFYIDLIDLSIDIVISVTLFIMASWTFGDGSANTNRELEKEWFRTFSLSLSLYLQTLLKRYFQHNTNCISGFMGIDFCKFSFVLERCSETEI